MDFVQPNPRVALQRGANVDSRKLARHGNERTSNGMVTVSTDFCLVLAIWGSAYPDASVNVLVDAAKKSSPRLKHVVLFTDRQRPQIATDVKQVPFPPFFDRPEFFGLGYRVKLAVFSRASLPPKMPCVYLDLDTMVTGDLGKIADLVERPCDLFMLPPGNLIGFGPIRRKLFRLTKGKRFATGNSSVMAYHSAAEPSMADLFEHRFIGGDKGPYMNIDDEFISWAGQPVARGVPRSMAVTFRREFLARSSVILWFRKHSPFRQKHRSNVVAITFNGTRYKPDELLKLRPGERISDARGRFGYWSDEHMGPLRQKILDYCQRITATK